MTNLQQLGLNPKLPVFPEGRFVQIVVLRQVQSHMILRTDEVTNVSQTRTSLTDGAPMTRITMVKRKQVASERRTGRMLMRQSGLLAEDSTDTSGKLKCEYNVAPCKRCPDCVLYGAAIGDALSIKSRVLTEDSFSLQPYAGNTTTLTFNGATEQGNMNRLTSMTDEGEPQGEMNTALGSQEHVNPGVVFPSLITLRDVTAEGLWYVLGNVLRTRRYGASSTKGGGMKNHLIGIVISDAEITSNLELALALTGQEHDPQALGQQAVAYIQQQLSILPVRSRLISGQELQELQQEVVAIYQSDKEVTAWLQTLQAQINDNLQRHVAHYAKPDKAKGKKGKAGPASAEE